MTSPLLTMITGIDIDTLVIIINRVVQAVAVLM